MRPHPGGTQQTFADGLRRRWSALPAIRFSRRLRGARWPASRAYRPMWTQAGHRRSQIRATRRSSVFCAAAVGGILLIVASESVDWNA